MLKKNDPAIWDSAQFGKGTRVVILGINPKGNVARVGITRTGTAGKAVKAETHALLRSLRPIPKVGRPTKAITPTN